MVPCPWTFVKRASRLVKMTSGNLPRTPSDVVGARVRALRKARDWTTDQLAQRCAELGAPELTDQVLFNIEAGRPDKEKRRRRYVTVEELLVLAQALTVSPADLLGGTDADYPFPPGEREQ
jgi:transcriptional regulator with XRE-family HTH domain